MATSLRLPPDLEADIEKLAKEHDRSAHGEMLHALRAYVEREKRSISENETDTLFSQGKLYPWSVNFEGQRVAIVLADTGGHACDYICQTRWLSRLKLSAHSMDAEVV
jgi:hypothetical protein